MSAHRGSRFDWLLHESFEISILLKGAFALVETAAGLLLWLIGPNVVMDLVVRFTAAELTEDPRDLIARTALNLAQSFSIETQHFYALYFITHGAVKLILVAGLLRSYRWAYPSSLVVMSIFIVYQIYQFSHTHGFGLIALTIFDLFVLALIWREWGRFRAAGA